jgi:tyrosyl-tRNA synthetase
MFGKIMSIKDSLILHYFDLCLDLKPQKLKDIKKKLRQKKVNPKVLKLDLAKRITKTYYGKKEADRAKKDFDRVFRQKKTPDDIKEIVLMKKEVSILDFLVKTGQAKSKSEAKRLILQRAVKINGKTYDNWKVKVTPSKGMVVKAGKRSFVKIV